MGIMKSLLALMGVLVVLVVILALGLRGSQVVTAPPIRCVGPSLPPWHPGMPPIYIPQVVTCQLPPGMTDQVEALLEYAQGHGIKPLWLGPNGLVGIASNGTIVVVPINTTTTTIHKAPIYWPMAQP